ncbi:MAG: tRNA lysidine(34) synthetase TilS, partial [Chloroflexota bacterium]
MAVSARLERLVAAALRRGGYSGNNTTLVVAVSGGPDSSALLYSLHRLGEQHRLRLHVAHLNHDFRGEEAEADARFVTALAQELGLPVTVSKRDPVEYQRQRRISSFEQAARELRYAFLADVATEAGAAAVALGHTADDLAETVLLHLLRGSGLHGLRGMAELAPWPWPTAAPGLSMFRPLLQATKAETVAYCQELGRDYRQDTGNYLGRFTRNRVRHDLLPRLAAEYNPRVGEALTRLARTAALELDYLEEEVDRVWPQVATAAEGAVSFHRAGLASLHPALQ